MVFNATFNLTTTYMQSVCITTNVRLNHAHREVYSKQHYVIKFVSDLRKIDCDLFFFSDTLDSFINTTDMKYYHAITKKTASFVKSHLTYTFSVHLQTEQTGPSRSVVFSGYSDFLNQNCLPRYSWNIVVNQLINFCYHTISEAITLVYVSRYQTWVDIMIEWNFNLLTYVPSAMNIFFSYSFIKCSVWGWG
jgi:hypothetical protein